MKYYLSKGPFVLPTAPLQGKK